MTTQLHSGLTLAAQTLRAWRRYPDRIAFSWDGGSLRYGAAADLVGRMQAVLAKRGLPRGGHVAMLSDNGAEAWCAGVAAQGLGLGVTWLHPKGSLSDQIFQIENSEACAFVADMTTHAERGAALIGSLPSGVEPIGLGESDTAFDLLSAAHGHGAAHAIDLSSPDEVALIHYTGGTTGRSKGAVRSNRAAVAFASYSVLADLDFPQTPHYLAIAPNSHAGGTLLLPTWRRGGTVHLVRKFDPGEIMRIIARERINMSFIVPTMLYMLLDQPDLDRHNLSSLSYVFYGAAPASPTRLIEAVARIGPVFAQGYGQTECYPISVLRREDHDPAAPERLLSCGMPVSTCEVRLLDPDGQEVAPGEPGEICARTPASMDGYWKMPELTAETLAGGWVHTGDIARQDERGYLYIVDRKKDLIITGGFNIYPREVEDALSQHASVGQAAVVGIPDDHWGEAVVAAVVARPGHQLDQAHLMAHVKACKGSIATPKMITVLDCLPMTSLGKIDKVALRSRMRIEAEGVLTRQ